MIRRHRWWATGLFLGVGVLSCRSEEGSAPLPSPYPTRFSSDVDPLSREKVAIRQLFDRYLRVMSNRDGAAGVRCLSSKSLEYFQVLRKDALELRRQDFLALADRDPRHALMVLVFRLRFDRATLEAASGTDLFIQGTAAGWLWRSDGTERLEDVFPQRPRLEDVRVSVGLLRITTSQVVTQTAHATARDPVTGTIEERFFFVKEGDEWKYDYPRRLTIESAAMKEAMNQAKRESKVSTAQYLRTQIEEMIQLPWREEALDGPLESISP